MKIMFLVAATFLGSTAYAWSGPPSPQPVASTESYVAVIESTPSPEPASSTEAYGTADESAPSPKPDLSTEEYVTEGESAPPSPEPDWIADEYFTEGESAPPSLDSAWITDEYFASGESAPSPVPVELGDLPQVPTATNRPMPDDVICRKYRPTGTHMLREFCATFAEIEAYRIAMQKQYREMGFH